MWTEIIQSWKLKFVNSGDEKIGTKERKGDIRKVKVKFWLMKKLVNQKPRKRQNKGKGKVTSYTVKKLKPVTCKKKVK